MHPTRMRGSQVQTDWRDDEDECHDDSDSEDTPAVSLAQAEPQPLLDRLAAIAELVRKPEKLIRRAARAFAHRPEITLKFSKIAAHKPTGFLARLRHLYGTLIPLDAEFRLVMEWFAASHVARDTS